MTVAVGDDRHELEEGDCLAMGLDEPVMFYNPTPRRRATRSSWRPITEAGDERAPAIRRVTGLDEEQLGDLADVVLDGVADGASFGFMDG